MRTVSPAGTPPVELLEVARRERGDLIVLGKHGTGNLRQFLLGSTAERVIHTAEVPVLVVSAQPAGPYASPLVALADTKDSGFVLDAALRIVPPALRRLDVVTAAFVPMEGWLRGGWTSSKEILRIKAMTRKRAREAVELALAPYRDRGLRARHPARWRAPTGDSKRSQAPAGGPARGRNARAGGHRAAPAGRRRRSRHSTCSLRRAHRAPARPGDRGGLMAGPHLGGVSHRRRRGLRR